jgi:competence protein ComEC
VTDLRLVAPAAVAWVTAAIVVGVPAAALWVALGSFLGAAALLALRHPTLAVCAVGAALVCTVVAVQAPSRSPELLLEAATAGRHVSGSVIASQVVRSADDAQWRGQLVMAGVGRQVTSMSVPVLVFGEAPDAGIGATLAVAGTVQPAEAGDDIAFLFFMDGPAELEAQPPWFLDWANGLRAGFRSSAAALPGDGGALLPGLAIGDTGAVSPSLSAAMKTSSLSHLTAVSGANCAIVIGLVLLAGARLGAPRAWRIGVSVAVLVAFIVLVTPEPSVVRAGVMALLVLVSLFFGRPVRGMPVLSLAVLVLLVTEPWLARNYGFILSVLATGGLLLLAGPLTRLLARWLPLWVAAVVAVPLAAQLACQPVLILLQPTIPAFGVIANLLAAPAAPIATVVGLLACIALPIAHPVGEFLARIAWLPSAWVAAVARFFASLPGAVPWLPGAVGALLLAGVTVFGLLGVLQRRRWALLTASGLLVGLLGASLGVHVTQQLQRPQNWQVAACEVGQGDAVIVRSAGQVALIDTGPLPAPLASCLTDLGIGHLDLLVLTHYDLDHVGGVDAVLGRASRVLVGPSGSAEDDAIAQRLRDEGAVVEQASRGLTGLLGELQWTVLWPPPRPVTEPGNDSSIAMTFLPVGACESGCLSSVFLGDLGEQPQALMLAAGPLPHVDVVKVAHHGSADQSARVYEQADATVGVIGVGENDYGHPNPRLLDLLAGVGTLAARTDTEGLVLLSPGAAPGEVALWTERPGDGGSG